jgi:hypothetical protein
VEGPQAPLGGPGREYASGRRPGRETSDSREVVPKHCVPCLRYLLLDRRITFLVRTPRTAIHTLDCEPVWSRARDCISMYVVGLGRLLSRMSRRGWGRAPLRRRPRHDEEVSLGAAEDAFAPKAEGDRDLP